MIQILLAGLVIGSMVILFSVSPYFGIFGVLLQAVSLSGLLCFFGHPLVGLLLIVVYVGGMMVVFLFSTVLCAEPYPEIKVFWVVVCSGGLYLVIYPWVYDWGPRACFSELTVVRLSSEGGFSDLFLSHWVFTCFIALILLIALVAVLVLGFAHKGGTLRKL